MSNPEKQQINYIQTFSSNSFVGLPMLETPRFGIDNSRP